MEYMIILNRKTKTVCIKKKTKKIFKALLINKKKITLNKMGDNKNLQQDTLS